MQQLPFKATVRKVGGSSVVTIPSYLIENNILTIGKEHNFNVEVEE